jgi:hypothetical protein
MYPTTILIKFGEEYSVSTLTTLAAALRIADYPDVLITLNNPSLTDEVALNVDPSTDGIVFNTGRRQTYYAAPGEQTHVELLNSQFGYVRISAATDAPDFPVVEGVTFEVRALRRDSNPS